MQSSYNLIKKGFSKTGDDRVISTEYKTRKPVFEKIVSEEIEEEAIEQIPKVDPEELLKRYEDIGQRIIQDAKNEKQGILLKAQMEANRAEKEAYEKGYAQGLENGYDDGYKKAYEENVEIAKAEAEEIIAKADKLLKSANEVYEEYLETKKLDIVKLALQIAEGITQRALSKDNSMNTLIEEAFKLSRGEDSIILKVNSIHVKELEKQSKLWKKTYGIKNDIFVVADDFMDPGNAVLEKPSGIVKVGIDIGMEQIQKAIFG